MKPVPSTTSTTGAWLILLRRLALSRPKQPKRCGTKGDYIPYYRDVGGILTLYIGSGHPIKLGDLKNQPHLQRLVGGEEKIMDYFNSSMQNTLILTDLSLRNLAVKNTAHTFNALGLLETSTGKDGKEHAIRNGDGPANANVLRFRDKGVDKHVVVRTEGTAYEHIPTELLVKGMEGIPVNTSALVRAMGFASNVVRKGVMLSPLYPVRQILRDSVAAPLLSGADFAGPLGALRALGNSATKQKLEARGITGGQVYTGTNQDLARILKDLMGGRMGLSQFVAKAEASFNGGRCRYSSRSIRLVHQARFVADGSHSHGAGVNEL